MKSSEARDLLKKYLNGDSHEREEIIVENFYQNLHDSGNMEKTEQEVEQIGVRMKQNILMKINEEYSGASSQRPLNRLKNKPALSENRFIANFWYSAVAALLLLLGTFSYFHFRVNFDLKPLDQQELSLIKPLPQNILISFSNGKDINPDTMGINKKVYIEPSLYVIKTQEGKIQYISSNAKNGVNSTINTSRASQFAVILSDGTQVYLNANSKLSFPSSFDNGNRKVKLIGEAYFEVMKTFQHSKFFVETDAQTIKVLGTKFNIRTGDKLTATKTTLVEGSVSIIPKNAALVNVIIKPNQEAVLSAGSVNVVSVDASKRSRWKDGYFVFDGANNDQLLVEIGNWYGMEVENRRAGSPSAFTGQIPTSATLGEILTILNFSGIKINVYNDESGKRKLIIL